MSYRFPLLLVLVLSVIVAGACPDPHPKGEHSAVHVSTNGGKTWRRLGAPLRKGYLNGLCASGKRAFAVGRGPHLLGLKRSRWWRLASSPAPLSPGAVGCDGKTIVVGGDRPVLLTSKDQGRSWSSIKLGVPSGSWIRAIRRIGKSFIAVGNQGVLLRSDDDGGSWVSKIIEPRDARGARYAFTDVWGTKVDGLLLVGARYGGAGPSGPVLFRTRDGGATLVPVASGVSAELNGLWGDGRGLVLGVGSGGAIVRSLDGGKTFEAVASGTRELLHAVTGDGRKTVLVVGSGGAVLRSVDRGKTFATVVAGIKGHNVNAVTWSEGAFYALSSHRRRNRHFRILSH